MALLLIGALALLALLATRPGQTLLAAFRLATFLLATVSVALIVIAGPEPQFVAVACGAGIAWTATFVSPVRARRSR